MRNFNLGLEMPKNYFGYPTVRKVLTHLKVGMDRARFKRNPREGGGGDIV